MSKLLSIFIAAFALAASSLAATHTVQMLSSPNSFAPANLTIDVGDTVIWRNDTTTFHDTVHNSPTPVWRSSLFRLGTYQFTFNVAPGTYSYYCTPHRPGMVGTITVRAANTPPTATITAPSNGQTFAPTDTIDVAVTAADNAGVARVELLVDGALAQTDLTAPYQFSLTLPVGSHTLQARAFDTPGLSGLSSIVTINVQRGNVPPSIQITSPTNNATFPSGQPITIVAEASDDDGIERVEFEVDSRPAGASISPPFTLAQTLPSGIHVILARAFDRTGLSSETSIIIGVDAPPPRPPEIFLLSPGESSYVQFPYALLETQIPPRPQVSLVARAEVAGGSITNVEFFVDENSAGVGAPQSNNLYSATLPLLEGPHTFFAIARDNSGLSATSAPVNFTVAMTAFSSAVALSPNSTNAIRVGFFGSSDIPYVFEYSTDSTNWFPFLTNVMHRRILFVELPSTNIMRIFKPRPPTPNPIIIGGGGGVVVTNPPNPPPIPEL